MLNSHVWKAPTEAIDIRQK